MQIYLPVAEISKNIFFLLGIGGFVGFLSGMFGVGGGFILTPLLILSGIPPVVAVASQVTQAVATSVSAVLSYSRQNSLDEKLAVFLIIGGIAGLASGMWVFSIFKEQGQIDVVISFGYVVLLSVIGTLMLTEAIHSMLRPRTAQETSSANHGQQRNISRLPFIVSFHRAKIRVSVIPVLAIGIVTGMLTAIMGIGGGFIIIPAMIYLLHVPTKISVGTSLLQILAVASCATCAHAVFNHAVDILLAFTLMVGSVMTSQFGVRLGMKLRSEDLRALLALFVLGTGLMLALDLITVPEEPFSVLTEKIYP